MSLTVGQLKKLLEDQPDTLEVTFANSDYENGTSFEQINCLFLVKPKSEYYYGPNIEVLVLGTYSDDDYGYTYSVIEATKLWSTSSPLS